MPRRNRKVREANRARAVKAAHRNATQMPQLDARGDGAPSGQQAARRRVAGKNARPAY